MTTPKDVGKLIKSFREERGWSQDELASRLGYKSRSSVNKIELGERNLTQSKLSAIAKIFGVSPLRFIADPLEVADPDIIGQILSDSVMSAHVQRLHGLTYDHRCQVYDLIDILHDREHGGTSSEKVPGDK